MPMISRETPSASDSQPRRKKIELEAAVKTEAHKLKRITEAQDALNALKASGEGGECDKYTSTCF